MERRVRANSAAIAAPSGLVTRPLGGAVMGASRTDPSRRLPGTVQESPRRKRIAAVLPFRRGVRKRGVRAASMLFPAASSPSPWQPKAGRGGCPENYTVPHTLALGCPGQDPRCNPHGWPRAAEFLSRIRIIVVVGARV